MLTTVLFDMGGTLEDIWNNQETRADAMGKMRETLHSYGLETDCSDEEFDRRVWAGVKAYKAWSEPNMRELKPEEIWPDYYLRDFDFDRGKLAAISEELNVHPAYLSRLFKAQTEMNLTDYISEKRLAHACRLLDGDTHTVKDVAALCGYDNYNYFFKVFKKYYGITPKEYQTQREADRRQ